MNHLSIPHEVERDAGQNRITNFLWTSLGVLTTAYTLTFMTEATPTTEEQDKVKTVEEAVLENLAASGQPTVPEAQPAEQTVAAAPVETVPTAPPPPPLPPEMLDPPCVETTIPWLPETVARWHPYVEQSARIHGVPPQMLDILMTFESLGNPHAESEVGALGLIQIMPATANGLLQQLGLPPLDLRDPASNIFLAGKYIRNYLNSGDVDISQGFNTESARQVAIVYHSGLGGLQDYRAGGRGALGPRTLFYSDHVAQAWDEQNSPSSQAYDHYISFSGAQALQAAGAGLGTPPCR